MSDQSIWSILNDAYRYGLLRFRYDPYDSFEAPSILAAEARAASSDVYIHPWICMAERVPASKIKFIFDLVDTQLFYLRPYAPADQIHPLISQPIVECCLRIPSYEMALDGVSRGLVRRAFRDALPAKVADRRSKGTTTSYFNQLLLKHLPDARELLLEGRLVQARVLDRPVLEKQLSEHSLIRGGGFRSVLDAVRAEAWLRAWQN
ncbi:MAG TPA: asparagine synthase-related protein [Rhodothermales bacterium]|nr:asparagine synthase-related protein [Rhodothermales bacterium]